MADRLKYFIKNYVFWLVFFLIQKPVFMLWQHSQYVDATCMDYVQVIVHGLPLDLSVAAYCTLFVGLWLIVSIWWQGKGWHVVMRVYTGCILALGLAVLLSDNGCFPSWGYHLDKTVFEFLKHPTEVLACAPTWVWLVALVAYVVLWLVCEWGYRWWMKDKKARLTEVSLLRYKMIDSVCLLLLTGLLFFPIRGSVSVSTMNTGRVYYSDNQMLNIAAINPVFNIVESLGENTFDLTKYTYMSTEEAQEAMRGLYAAQTPATAKTSLLTTTRPNVVLLILESFSLNAWEQMPRMQQLAEEGVCFTNVFASSYRTDRGVVAIMSGFPGQPTSSLMTVPYKAKALPQLGRSLKAVGYNTAFYYGGDEDFTNMRSYLINGCFEDRLNDHSFAVQDRRSKWGVPDHVLMARAAKDIAAKFQQTQPGEKRLDVVMSLSSHEPFEVPYHHLNHPYLNAIAYTDSCVGALVDTLRQLPAWDSLVVVMVADHGYPYPDGLRSDDPARFRIPVVVCGGAVRQPMHIHTLCSQIDIVPTLLGQMQLPTDDYLFGKDIMASGASPFAFYAFNDGFALLADNDTIVIDAKANKVIKGNNTKLEHTARAFVQTVVETIEQL